MAEPSDEQLRDALQELKAADLLVQALSSLSSLAVYRLTNEPRDPGQARLAIEVLRALKPVLHDALPAEVARDFDTITANLQLAYAQALAPEGEEQAEPGAG